MFITIIPKEQIVTFGDHQTISCCNVVYKLVAKIIPRRHKPIVTEIISEEQFGFLQHRQIHDVVEIDIISEEQFGFLQHRQIHDVVEITQESLHSVKHHNHEVKIINLDLSKAYDRVRWNFLSLALLKIGMDILAVNGIIGCV
jgi:hypothetical protein